MRSEETRPTGWEHVPEAGWPNVPAPIGRNRLVVQACMEGEKSSKAYSRSASLAFGARRLTQDWGQLEPHLRMLRTGCEDEYPLAIWEIRRIPLRVA